MFGVDSGTNDIWTIFGPAVSIAAGSASGPVVAYGGLLTAGTTYTVTVAPGEPDQGTYTFTAPTVTSLGAFPGIALTPGAPPPPAPSAGAPGVRNDESIKRTTRAAVGSFMNNRANAAMGAGPDSGRLHARLADGSSNDNAVNGIPAPAGFAPPETAGHKGLELSPAPDLPGLAQLSATADCRRASVDRPSSQVRSVL